MSSRSRGQKGEEVERSNPKEKDLAATQMRPKDSLIEVLILRRRLYVVQKMGIGEEREAG